MKILSFIIIVIITNNISYSQITLARWNFNNTNIPNEAITSNNSAIFNYSGSTNSPFYSNGCGTGCTVSDPPFYSLSNWTQSTVYWETTISTLGYESIRLSSSQRSSNTGPSNFSLQIDYGSGFQNMASISIENNFSAGQLNDFDLGMDANNKNSITIRWLKTGNTAVNGGSIASAGTSGIDDVLITGDIIMPVKYSNIQVIAHKNTSLIHFATASETHNDYFTIERSADGRKYEAIGTLKGAGNSSNLLQYIFIDESPLMGTNYYRVQQTDFDGALDYSEVKSVRHMRRAFDISLRITEGRMVITTDWENYTLTIYALSGQEVKRYTRLSWNQDIDIDDLISGVYFINIRHAYASETLRIVKL